jgi:hypothetical protein
MAFKISAVEALLLRHFKLKIAIKHVMWDLTKIGI